MGLRLSAILIALTAVIASENVRAGDELTTEFVGTFSNPTFLTALPDDGRQFVLERNGRIRIISDGAVVPTPFLNLSGQVDPFFEGGLLGLAFHPDYIANDKFYVNYTRTGPDGLITVIEEYTVSDDPNVADRGSARLVLEIVQPAPNHNGGWIGFSPNDGYLYIPLGDGGFEGSGPERAQMMTDQLLGKVLRIDVDGDDFPEDAMRNYAIPPDNPFVGTVGDDEIWALGLRNPYRCSFDRVTGDLWMADVGSFSWEEIDFQPGDSPGGENYGWGCMEAHSCQGGFCVCMAPELTLPIHAYSHSSGCAIVGGPAYRGCAMPELDGVYFFGDYCSGRVWTLRRLEDETIEVIDRTAELGTQNSLAAIGEDHLGELYLILLNGTISRIVPQIAKPGACTIPGDLTGDGDVTTADVLLMLKAWGPCDPDPPCDADLNGDGTVNVADLLILLAYWSEF